MQSNYN